MTTEDDLQGADGTFICPICGDSKPHHHAEKEITAFRENGIRTAPSDKSDEGSPYVGPAGAAFKEWLDSHAGGGASMTNEELRAVWEGFWAGWYAKEASK